VYAPSAYSIKPPGPSGNESPKPAKPTNQSLRTYSSCQQVYTPYRGLPIGSEHYIQKKRRA